MLGSRWSKDELECFYGAYREYGKDWRKIAGAITDRTSDMVEALYNMNKAYLSLPEGTATAAGLTAMMTDHYNILDGSNSDRESNDSSKASRRPQKRGHAEFQFFSKTSDKHCADLLQSQPASSSYGCLSLSKKKRFGVLFVGNRPQTVGKRTPRVPVASMYHEDDMGVPNIQAKPDANNGDDEGAHVAALALAEIHQRGGSSQVSHTPGRSGDHMFLSPAKSSDRKNADSDMGSSKLHGFQLDADYPEASLGSREADTSDYTKGASYLMTNKRSPCKPQKKVKRPQKRRKKAARKTGDQFEDDREACCGTEERRSMRKAKEEPKLETMGSKTAWPSTSNKRSRQLFFDDGFGDKKGDTEHFKTRFSVHRIRELVPDFNENQKKWINGAGVGALLSMSEFSIPVKLVQWIMKHIDPLLSEFRFHNKVIAFDRPLVCKILGLETGVNPLKLSVDVENIDVFLKIRDQYREGERAKIKKCIEVLKSSNDRESFLRAFMLLALGTVYCPGTTNGVSMKYLHSLIDISQIRNYDWAGHIIDVLMDEVKKYQKFSFTRLQHDHQIGSCLAILAIAYMDHLDIPTDRGTHQINYALPRICNVSNKDFDFIMKVDKSRLQPNAYGRLPFRANTPYSAAPITNEPIVNDEALVASSGLLDEWLHPSGSHNQFLQQLPPEHQKIVAEYNSLVEHDIDELADAMTASFKAKSKEIWRNRCGEMMSKIIKINEQNQGNAIVAANASSSGKETANQKVDLTSKVVKFGIVDENNIT